MKVIHYLPHLFVNESGPASVVLALSRALVRQGVDVGLLFDPAANRVPLPEDLDLHPIEHRFREEFRVPVDFTAALAEADLIVLHGGWAMDLVVAGRSARRANVPYLVCPHGNLFPEVLARRALRKRLWLATLERPLLNRALAVHIFFPQEHAHLKAAGIHNDTVVVPNGLDVPPGVRWDGGSGGYLLWYGRYDVQHKAIDLLLRGLARVPADERPALRMHGPDWRGGMGEMRDLVRELDLEQWVSLGYPIHGTEKWDALASAKGFVYPSRWEASPIAPGEAVSAGVPTLVTDYPMGRLLADYGAAVIADRTPSALADGIRRLMLPETTAMAERGRELAARMFTWDAVAVEWKKQVEDLLQKRAR